MDDPFPAGMLADIEDFLRSEESREEGLDLYEEVFARPLFFPLQRQAELSAMIRRAKLKQPKVVMEIGADKGGGLYHWCKSIPSVKRVIACEIRGTPYCDAFEEAFPHIDFLWLPVSSYDQKTVDHVVEWLGEDRIDCLFIDGDKLKFFTDFQCYVPLMNKNGIVFMHDINDGAPSEGFKQAVKEGDFLFERIVDVSDWEREKELQENGIHPKTPHAAWLRYWKGKSCGVGVIYLG